MCGVAGGTSLTRDHLDAMRSSMIHRGPDADDVWLMQGENAGAGFAHTRLSILDLSSKASQPMESPCGRYVLTYNGEIYNYRTLRQDLLSRDEQFVSDGDTEVLLRLLVREGKQAVNKLVGMFAFALWDKQSKTMLLGRDRMGIKPLVYAHHTDGNLSFASEIATLREVPGLDLSVDRQALSQYLACLYVPAPRTIHQGIRKLPPGHLLEWSAGNITIEPYWQPAFTGEREISMAEAAEEVLPALRAAVVDRMVADVPLGCFLSGGIDSSTIAALMAAENVARGAGPVRSFTMTFTEKMYDEREAAKSVSDHIGSLHTELPASSDLVGLMDSYVSAFGEPFGNPTALLINDLSRKAKEHVSVALVGDGGDEVFAGYPRYKGGMLAGRYKRMVPGFLRKGLISPLASLIPESTTGHHGLRRAREFLQGANLAPADMYAGWVEYFTPLEREGLLGLEEQPASPIAELYQSAPSNHPLDAMQQTDLLSFLPGNLLAYGDAMSMQHALELRVPLIDHRVVEAVGRIAPGVRFAGEMKAILKTIARRLLPADIVDRPKLGFNPPMGVWLGSDLKGMVHERLTAKRMESLGFMSQNVETLLKEHYHGGRDHSLKIWSLLVYDVWERSIR